MLYLSLLLLGSRGVGGECWAFLYGRRGEGSLFEQLPLPQQAGVHDSAKGKRREKRVGLTEVFRSRSSCLSRDSRMRWGPSTESNSQPHTGQAKSPSRAWQRCPHAPGAVTTSPGSNLVLVRSSFSPTRTQHSQGISALPEP